MNHENWKEFVNNLFVDENGKRRPAVIGLTIEAGGEKLVLPPIKVSHIDTLQQIFKNIDKMFADNETETNTAIDANVSSIAKRTKAVNVEHITHGNTEYIVYRMSDESFRVVKTTGETVTPKSVIYNTVVKKYREKFDIG